MVVGQSLKLLWNETRKDQVSDLESRAKRLAVVSDTTPYPVLILLIFNNTKGVPIESISDPRIRHLRQFLKHSNESVRMQTGCWAFLEAQGSSVKLWTDMSMPPQCSLTLR